METTTTIRITQNLKSMLDSMGTKTESYEDIIKKNIQFVKKFADEDQFSEWFEKNFFLFGFDEIKSKHKRSCPDFILLKNGKEIRVELETISSNFTVHGHSPDEVDMVICLLKNKELPVYTIEIEPFEFISLSSTVQVYTSDLKKLNALALRGQPLRDIIKKLLDNHEVKIDNSNPSPYTDYGTREYNKTKIPDNGRVRLTKAAGKTIEWRVKDE